MARIKIETGQIHFSRGPGERESSIRAVGVGVCPIHNFSRLKTWAASVVSWNRFLKIPFERVSRNTRGNEETKQILVTSSDKLNFARYSDKISKSRYLQCIEVVSTYARERGKGNRERESKRILYFARICVNSFGSRVSVHPASYGHPPPSTPITIIAKGSSCACK